MLVSHRYKFIFVHIQRTGGSSLEKILREVDPDAQKEFSSQTESGALVKGRHLFARDIKPHLESEIWENYYKFAVVRNPWDRLVSWYNMISQRESDLVDRNKFWQYVQKNAHNFEEFITRCDGIVTEDYGEEKSASFNQADYITDDNGELIVDFVGRFEQLPQHSKKIFKHIGLNNISLPCVNAFKHDHYSQYYDEKLREIVSQRFSKDMEMFGYTFEKEEGKVV